MNDIWEIKAVRIISVKPANAVLYLKRNGVLISFTMSAPLSLGSHELPGSLIEKINRTFLKRVSDPAKFLREQNNRKIQAQLLKLKNV